MMVKVSNEASRMRIRHDVQQLIMIILTLLLGPKVQRGGACAGPSRQRWTCQRLTVQRLTR